MRSPLDTSTLILAAAAVVLAVVAYLKDPGPYHGWWSLAGVVTPGGPMVTGWLVSVFSHE
jgi:hypothetical protein